MTSMIISIDQWWIDMLSYYVIFLKRVTPLYAVCLPVCLSVLYKHSTVQSSLLSMVFANEIWDEYSVSYSIAAVITNMISSPLAVICKTCKQLLSARQLCVFEGPQQRNLYSKSTPGTWCWKVHSVGYIAVVDNTGLSSFVQLTFPPKYAKSAKSSENSNL